jgi:hypothetical protein
MKKLSLKILVILVVGLAQLQVQAQTTSYGDELSEAKAVKAAKLEKAMDGKQAMPIKLEGEISEVCQSKGCWMTVNTGDGQTIRVTFKDYGFFVAKDAAGKKAVFEGEAKMETVDVATLRHYAEDAGKSEEEVAAITKSETKLTFVANGVEIEQ